MQLKTLTISIVFVLCSLIFQCRNVDAISADNGEPRYSFELILTDASDGSVRPKNQELESDLKDAVKGDKCGNNRRLIGYVPNWSTRPLSAKQAMILTNAIYAFVEMDSGGRLKIPDDTNSQQRLNELLTARRIHIENGKDFKVSFAVGGWADSTYFSSVLNSPDKQAVFIAEIQRMIEKYEFDGVDIDWEYPVTGGALEGFPEDRPNYVTFLSQLRDKWGSKRLISIAAAAGTEAFQGFDVKNIVKYVDWIGVMSYDFFGAWESKWGSFVGPNAPLYYSAPPGYSGKLNVNWAIKQYTCIGEQPNKIVMGVPFYGRFWYKTTPGEQQDYPIYRIAEPNGNGAYGGSVEYWELLNDWKIESNSAYEKHWDEGSMTPWAINNNGLVVTYDNEKSIAAKIKYANNQNLAGVMIWAVDQDDTNYKLAETVFKELCNAAVSKANTFKCNPLGEEKRWWTFFEDKEKAGMCGRNAPLYTGYYPVCDPDDPGYSCCSNSGFCGSGSSFCDCPKCADYGKNPELLVKEPVKPTQPIQWHVGFDVGKPGMPRCGPKAPKLENGKEAICNPDGDDYCCSPGGYCGSGKEFCDCNGCRNFRTQKTSSASTPFSILSVMNKLTNLLAP